MALTYEVDENNAVTINDTDLKASFTQKEWPNGDPWNDADEASNWAKLYIASVEDANALYPPASRNEPGKQKVTKDQINKINSAYDAIKKAKNQNDFKSAQDLLKNTLAEIK